MLGLREVAEECAVELWCWYRTASICPMLLCSTIACVDAETQKRWPAMQSRQMHRGSHFGAVQSLDRVLLDHACNTVPEVYLSLRVGCLQLGLYSIAVCVEVVEQCQFLHCQ